MKIGLSIAVLTLVNIAYFYLVGPLNLFYMGGQFVGGCIIALVEQSCKPKSDVETRKHDG